MKLNAPIIYERLKRKYPVKMYGESTSDMSFSSAELYIDNTLRFYSGHVYLATVEHLPHRPVIEKNVILICMIVKHRSFRASITYPRTLKVNSLLILVVE